MGDEPLAFSTLVRFHREVLLPHVERVVGGAVEGVEKRAALRTGVQELRSKMASLEARIDELESEI